MQKGFTSKKVLPRSVLRPVNYFSKHKSSKQITISKLLELSRKNTQINDENEDITNFNQNINQDKISAGITKRIKKVAIPSQSTRIKAIKQYKPILEIENLQDKENNLFTVTISDKIFRCFPDTLVDMPQHFREFSLPHTQDNDCDSDWDQVEAGAYKLYGSFKQAILENKQI